MMSVTSGGGDGAAPAVDGNWDSWRPIDSAPGDGTVVLTDQGTAAYVDRRHWGSPVTSGWYLCAWGDDPDPDEDRRLYPKRWLPEAGNEVPPPAVLVALAEYSNAVHACDAAPPDDRLASYLARAAAGRALRDALRAARATGGDA